ncbi:hypothetical protein SOVF_206200, partial [Spinacia oleracea]
MDSSNLHHHLQDNQHVVADDNSPSLSSPCFNVADNHHAWRPPTFFLNNGNIHATTCDELATPNSLNNPLIQEVGFPWPNDHISINQSTSHQPPPPPPPQQQQQQQQQQQVIADKTKEEPSTSLDHHDNPSFAKISDMLSPSTSSSSEMLHVKNTLSPTYKNHMLSNYSNRDLHHPSSSLFQASIQHYQNSKGISTSFSQIYPSVNISNMSSPILSSSSGTIDHDQIANNNVQGGFDLFATARFLSGDHSCPNSNNLLELFEGSPRFSVDHDLQPSNNDLKLCNIPNNLSSFNNNGVIPAESKNHIMKQQSTHHPMPSKKQRFESRASFPPLKVRKEKLGDRVAALQQLVAPFGK